jgi:hypothetical protein
MLIVTFVLPQMLVGGIYYQVGGGGTPFVMHRDVMLLGCDGCIVRVML